MAEAGSAAHRAKTLSLGAALTVLHAGEEALGSQERPVGPGAAWAALAALATIGAIFAAARRMR